jgi:hypothetical protein
MVLTEKAGLWGKDLCKKGLEGEDKKMYFCFALPLRKDLNPLV